MKKGTAFFGFLLTSFAFVIIFPKKLKAEKYLCKFDLSNLNRVGEVEYTYQREGNTFFSYYEGEKIVYSILKETSKFITLTNTWSFNHPEVLVTFIDKYNKEAYEIYLDIKDGGKPVYPVFGNCIILR